MHVAVAEMAEGAEPDPRHRRHERRAGPGQEFRHAGHRHRDVVLDARALERLCVRDGFAQAPEIRRLGAAFRDHRIEDEAAVHGLGEHGLEGLAQAAVAASRAQLDQQIVVVGHPERVARIRDVAQHEVETEPLHPFERRHVVVAQGAGAGEQLGGGS